MSQRTAQFMLAFGVLAFLALPGSSLAGHKLKEHECVGKDTQLDLADDPGTRDVTEGTDARLGEDAHCTPLRSEILPPGGDFYGVADEDESAEEEFRMRGALEYMPLPSNRWQTVPTIKEVGFNQHGFEASASYEMYIKSSSVVSDLEVTCTVCAERPQGMGPGQTFVPHSKYFNDAVAGTDDFTNSMYIKQEPWTLEARQICSPANPHDDDQAYGPPCGGKLRSISIPGLYSPWWSHYSQGYQRGSKNGVTFIGCKPTTVLYRNPETFFQGDRVKIRIKAPDSARVHGTFDVTSCELSYLRGCLPGEEQFKPNICKDQP